MTTSTTGVETQMKRKCLEIIIRLEQELMYLRTRTFLEGEKNIEEIYHQAIKLQEIKLCQNVRTEKKKNLKGNCKVK